LQTTLEKLYFKERVTIHEEAFKDANEYYRQAPARFPSENEVKDWPRDFAAQAPKRTQENFRLMLRKVAMSLIGIYQQYIRAAMPDSCRFSPSCSEYTKQAICKYGFLRGIIKGMTRLLNCHPFSRRPTEDPLK